MSVPHDDPYNDPKFEMFGMPEKKPQNGRERVNKFWRELVNLNFDTETRFVFQTGSFSFLGGFFYGTIATTYTVREEFKLRFNDYQFKGQQDVARKLSDVFMVGLARRGLNFGLRSILISVPVSCIFLTSTLYHNYVSFVDLTIAVSLMGSIHRFMKGPKGMLAGALVGAPIGFLSACALNFYLWSTGSDINYITRYCEENSIKENEIRSKLNHREIIRYAKLKSFLSHDIERQVSMHDDTLTRKEKGAFLDETDL